MTYPRVSAFNGLTNYHKLKLVQTKVPAMANEP